MLRVRWLMLSVGVFLIISAFLQDDMKDAAIAFIVGMVVGFGIDYGGFRIFSLWDYPRQPFLGLKYFSLVVPSWGIFGMTINLLWGWIADPILVVIFLFIGQMFVYEVINFKTKSWAYYVPMWIVFVGWFPLVLTFRAIFLASCIII